NRRLVDIYESPEPSAAEIILNAKSVQEAIDTLHYLSSIANQDKRIAREVADARDEVHATREKTKKVRSVVASETHVVAVRTQQQRDVKDQLVASRSKLAGARYRKRQALASTKQQEQVVIAGWVSGYGNYTCIDHGGGMATCYAHQSSFATSVGAHVTQGQVIGYTGCTGHCFGPHLHFEVRINGTPVDPLGYL